MFFSVSRKKALLLMLAAGLIFTAFWLSGQSAGIGAPELVRVKTEKLVSDLHPLDKLLIRYPREGRALKGFYREADLAEIGSFELDRCEVTQGDYGRFLQWFQRSRLRDSPGGIWNPPGLEDDADWLSRTRDHKFLGRNEVPVTGIRPAAAQTYCRLMGGNLPTELEWEAAASGAEQRLYPWGDQPPSTTRLFHDPILNVARACRSQPESDTPSGLSDMGSGVSNLTLVPPKYLMTQSTESRPDSLYALKGGGWRQPDAIHSLNFLRAPAGNDLVSNYVGFRCAYPVHSRSNRRLGRALISPWKSKMQTVFIPGRRYAFGRPGQSILLQLSASVNMSQYLGLIEQAGRAEEDAGEHYVSKSEVTVRQYQRFLENPVARLGFYDHPVQPAEHDHKPARWQRQLQAPDKPVRGVSWWSAMAYAEWLGGTLPSEQEWMLLAGGLNRIYPDVSNSARGVLRDPQYLQHLHAALDSDNDFSSSGLVALGGNVMEWTRTIIPGNSLNFVLKGGSYRTPGEATQIANTSFAPPEYASVDLGFRVIFFGRPHWLAQ